MTFNGLNDHFILNFHYYELTFRVLLADFESIIYLFTVVCLHAHVTSGDVVSREADRDPQNVWNLPENRGSVVDVTSSDP